MKFHIKLKEVEVLASDNGDLEIAINGAEIFLGIEEHDADEIVKMAERFKDKENAPDMIVLQNIWTPKDQKVVVPLDSVVDLDKLVH